jgi:hypothetical protein
MEYLAIGKDSQFVTIGIFLFSAIFPSLVYAAVITCGPVGSSPL